MSGKTRSALMKTLNRSVETLGLEILTFSVAFILSQSGVPVPTQFMKMKVGHRQPRFEI